MKGGNSFVKVKGNKQLWKAMKKIEVAYKGVVGHLGDNPRCYVVKM
jgi:hypothetical protein